MVLDITPQRVILNHNANRTAIFKNFNARQHYTMNKIISDIPCLPNKYYNNLV